MDSSQRRVIKTSNAATVVMVREMCIRQSEVYRLLSRRLPIVSGAIYYLSQWLPTEAGWATVERELNNHIIRYREIARDRPENVEFPEGKTVLIEINSPGTVLLLDVLGALDLCLTVLRMRQKADHFTPKECKGFVRQFIDEVYDLCEKILTIRNAARLKKKGAPSGAPSPALMPPSRERAGALAGRAVAAPAL